MNDTTLKDWKYEVMNDDTRLGYEEWLEHQREADEMPHEQSEEEWRDSLLPADDAVVEHNCEPEVWRHVVMFVEKKFPLYFDRLTNSQDSIRGFVENGHYDIWVTKDGDARYVYVAFDASDICDDSCIRKADVSDLEFVFVPEEFRNNYTTAINYALDKMGSPR